MSEIDDQLLSPSEVARARELLNAVRAALGSVILGQPDLLDLTVMALAARGHLLLEGLPGLGKTELVKALAASLGLGFKRVQFTPDLLPSDITGGPVLEEHEGKRQFIFHPGPLFANLVLADEINRASPKTQSALLEAMQERRVTVLGTTRPLPEPFFVLATQNPIELEGTYPLPEAQLDRFLFKVDVPAVSEDVLASIIKTRRRGTPPALSPVLDEKGLRELFGLVDRVFLPDPVARFVARLVSASHPARAECPSDVKPFVRFGASPRAAIAIAEAARAAAIVAGRPNVDFKDVERVATAAMAHRLVLEHTARLEGITGVEIVRRLLVAVDPLGREAPKELRA